MWDFLVAQEQKLGARGHGALLEHSPGLYKLKSEMFVLNDVLLSSDLTVLTLFVQLVLYHYQHFWFL